ncbi:MAG: hypothetical protein IKI11_06720 [Neisseriaceae bacterium]|nr:hypothetical protein [Neisseriaceae bacterium]
MFAWWHKPWGERTTAERIMGIVVAAVIATVFIALLVGYFFYLRPKIMAN